jgi:cytidylate kinase
MAVIAISQQLGSRGIELGRLVASELGYGFVTGDEIIADTARRFDVSAEELLLFDLRTPRFWERARSESHRYLAFFRAVLLARLAGGAIVAAGRSLAHQIPAMPCALRVRVVAPLAARIRQVAGEEKIDPQTAERRVREHDRELKSRTQSLSGIDVDDVTLYDLIVNSAAHPLEVHAATLAETARAIDRAGGREQLSGLRDGALAAQVHAALLAHPKVRDAEVAVSCTGGVVRINGPGLVPPWDDLVGEIARRVEGIRKVEVVALDAPPPLRTE